MTVLVPNLTEMPDSKALKPEPLTFTLSPVVASDRPKDRTAVTAKEACPAMKELVAPMDLAPPAVFEGMLTSVKILPWLSALTTNWVAPSRVILTEEPGLKPEPRTVTELPGGPLEGEILKEDFMMKLRTILPTLT